MLRLRLLLLRRRSRKRPRAPDKLPPVPSNDAEGWLMRVRPDGTKEHFARAQEVTRDPPPLHLLPEWRTPERTLRPSEVLRLAARRRSHDETWGR